jgi:methylmalonyl-CoA mutase
MTQPNDTPSLLFGDFPPVSTEDWRAQIALDLRETPFERLVWHTPEGFDVQPFYRAEDRPPTPPLPPVPWQLRQDFPVGAQPEARHWMHEALEQGVETPGLLLTDDLSPLDDLLGVPAQALPDRMPWHLVAGPHAEAALDRWVDGAVRRGIDSAHLQGTLDVRLAELLVRGEVAPLEQATRLCRRAVGGLPHFRPFLLDAAPWHNAGATLVQCLALLLAATAEALVWMTGQGLAAHQAVPLLHLGVPVGSRYFLEIAHLRALRKLWPQVVGAFDTSAATLPPFIQATTSWRNLTLADPYVNLLRGTTEAAAALLGGCDTLTVQPFDGAAGTGDARSLRLARNIPLLLRHEGVFDAVADPGAGSYYLEALTDTLAREAWGLFQQIEAEGGLAAAWATGTVPAMIAQARAAEEQRLALRRQVLVGTNHYPNPEDEPLPAPAPAPAAEGLLPSTRLAVPFEALRQRTQAHAAATGHSPAVLLLPFGPPALRNARATFARNFFGCAGFTLHEAVPVTSVAQALDALDVQPADLLVLCSADEAYRPFAEALLPFLKARPHPPFVIIAGDPVADREALQASGVDGFVHLRSPLLETLTTWQARLLG